MPKGKSTKAKSNIDEWIFECEHMSDNDLEDEYINNNNDDHDDDNVENIGQRLAKKQLRSFASKVGNKFPTRNSPSVKSSNRNHNNLPHPFYHFKDSKIGHRRVKQTEQIKLNNETPKVDTRTKNFMRSILGIDV